MINLRGVVALMLFSGCGAAIVLGCGDDGKSVDPDNNPPTIVSITAAPDTFVANHSSTITVVAEDSDGDALNYVWETYGSQFMALPSETNTMVLTNCCPIIEPVSAMVHAIVDDGRGGTARDSVRVWAIPSGSR
ncbi:MAG TPA: hypothetical protein VM118_04730 [Acidobacteriota bacterium]|nr:hypothetical protein [Acidobacteriota bacterium]